MRLPRTTSTTRRVWLLSFVAVFGVNLPLLAAGEATVAWAESHEEKVEEEVREPAPEEIKVEEEVKEPAPEEIKVEDRLQLDSKFAPSEPDGSLGLETEAPNYMELDDELVRLIEPDDLSFDLEKSVDQNFEDYKFNGFSAEVDGVAVEVKQEEYVQTDFFGRKIKYQNTEIFDPFSKQRELSQSVEVLGAVGLKDDDILGTFEARYRLEIASAVLAGNLDESESRVLMSLTEDEKDALFGTKSFAQEAQDILSFKNFDVFQSVSISPTADFGIGASGADDVIVPFSPQSSERASQELAEIAVSASVAATAATAAAGAVGAAGAAAGAAGAAGSAGAAGAAGAAGSAGAGAGAGAGGSPNAPSSPAPSNSSAVPGRNQNSTVSAPKEGASGGGTGAGGGGGRLNDGLESYADVNEDVFDALAIAEYDTTNKTAAVLGKFEAWLHQRRWRRLLLLADPAFQRFFTATRSAQLVAKIADDSAYLRAFIGPFYVLLPTIAATFGALGAIFNTQAILHPPIWVYLLLVCFGALDTLSGLTGITSFLLLSVGLVDALSLADIRTVIGVLISCVGPAFVARSLVGFRRHRDRTPLSRIRDLSDLAFSALVGGWIASISVRAMPSLSGLSLPAANHVDTFFIAASGAFLIRVSLEIAAARLLPQRMAHLAPEEAPTSSARVRMLWVLLRFGFVFLLSTSFLGFGWEAWVISALAVAPNAIGLAQDKLPLSERLWKGFPYGILAFLTILVLEIGIETALSALYSGANFSTYFMLILMPTVAVMAAIQTIARPKEPAKTHWWESFDSALVKALASVSLFVALFVAVQFL